MQLVNNSFLPDDVDSFEILVLRRKRREIKYPFWMGFETCVLVSQRCKTKNTGDSSLRDTILN